MLVPRALEKKAKQLARQFGVVAILGPRQSGKTTLAKMAFPKHQYVSLENPDTREFALNDPNNFLSSFRTAEGVIIDEAQLVPSLFSYIQTLVDETQRSGQFILTGSQNFLLNEKITQSLAGRVALLTLLPFSISEIKMLPDKAESLMFLGCYPSVLTKQISPLDWYPNYIHSYIEKDVRQIKNITDLLVFHNFVRLLASRVGQQINFSDLGRDIGISYNTAKAWISLLTASYIVFLLPPYHKNFGKRLTKSPKLYFYDPGLVCQLLGIRSEKELEVHFLRGYLFESFILSEIVKQHTNHGIHPNLYFWRDKMGHEIDCLIEDGALRAVEIKASHTISSHCFKGLSYWHKLSQTASKNSYLVYSGQENQTRSAGNVVSWKNLEVLRT